jgi:hypothetical protein
VDNSNAPYMVPGNTEEIRHVSARILNSVLDSINPALAKPLTLNAKDLLLATLQRLAAAPATSVKHGAAGGMQH